jgi:hypothetical protein
MVGRQAVRFPSPTAQGLALTSLPEPNIPGLPGYQGQVATRTQNIQYNENGDILFFIVDNQVFNGDGMLIADAAEDAFDRDCQVCFFGGNELHIVPVPGSCTRFYVFSLYERLGNPGPDFATMRIGVLDLSLESDLPVYDNVCIPVKGRFMSSVEQFTPFDLDAGPGWVPEGVAGLQSPVEVPHYLWEGSLVAVPTFSVMRGATMELAGENAHLFIATVNQSLFTYFITNTGLRRVDGIDVG